MDNPSKSSGVAIRKTADEVLVHDETGGKIHILNATAGFVLERCDGRHSCDDIARELSDATGADGLRVRADVDTIVDRFVTLGIVTLKDPH